MHGGIDAHRHFVGVLIGNLLIDIEKVAVAFFDRVSPKTLDGIGEIKIDTESAGTDPAPVIAGFLGTAAGDVAGREISKTRVLRSR
jgi:hypothetical protein